MAKKTNPFINPNQFVETETEEEKEKNKELDNKNEDNNNEPVVINNENEEDEIEEEEEGKKVIEEVIKNPPVVEEDDEFTIKLTPLILKLRDPEQTLGLERNNKTELMGISFDPVVFKVLTKDKKEKGRGWQSHLVNELVKAYYKNQGKL